MAVMATMTTERQMFMLKMLTKPRNAINVKVWRAPKPEQEQVT